LSISLDIQNRISQGYFRETWTLNKNVTRYLLNKICDIDVKKTTTFK
jgi:hypothetical protein